MHKLLTPLASLAVLAGIAIGFSACKDDDEAPQRASVSFSSTALSVSEGESGIKANIVLNNPAPQDLIVEYTVAGSATRKLASNAGDFEIVGTPYEIVVAKGQTTGSITLNVIADNTFEQDETIIITIVDVSTENVEIGDDDQMTVTIAGGGSVEASFAATSLTVNESEEGVHEIVVNLSEAVAADVTVQYELSSWFDAEGNYVPGSAIDSLSAYNEELPSDYYDYYIDGTAGQLTIPAGQTSGTIRVNVLSDFLWEDAETFNITLINSTGVTVGDNASMSITINQEDGKIVELSWPEETDADMDLFIWLTLDDEGESFSFPITYSINAGTQGPETRFIPNAFSESILAEFQLTTLQYGASYVYYEGTVDPLNFEVIFADLVDDQVSLIQSSEGTYTVANINAWDQQGAPDPIIVQTFEYSNGELTNISDITTPQAGSRVRAGKIQSALKKMNKRYSLIRSIGR